jgi:hypothetical protein
MGLERLFFSGFSLFELSLEMLDAVVGVVAIR